MLNEVFTRDGIKGEKMEILRKTYCFLVSVDVTLRSYLWCRFNSVKYKKGVNIGHHVRKDRHVILTLSEYTRISNDVTFMGNGPIKIGYKSSIGSWGRLYAHEGYGIEIGDYVNAASHIYIIDSNHGIKAGEIMMNQPSTHEKVTIGDDIWFGYHVMVLPGVNLNNGIVCGACSVITKSFPENAIICGNPAKLIKFRN